MSGAYEAMRDAASDYAWEIAHEMLHDGSFNDDIKQMIREGQFDDAVKERLVKIPYPDLAEELERRRQENQEVMQG